MVRVVEELLVYQKALDASDEISAMLKAKEFAKDRRLREQLGAASERVVSSISEGFDDRYVEIEKMLRSLIRRLDEDDWRNRR